MCERDGPKWNGELRWRRDIEGGGLQRLSVQLGEECGKEVKMCLQAGWSK